MFGEHVRLWYLGVHILLAMKSASAADTEEVKTTLVAQVMLLLLQVMK